MVGCMAIVLNKRLRNQMDMVEMVTKIYSSSSINLPFQEDRSVFIRDFNKTVRNANYISKIKPRTLMNVMGLAAVMSLVDYLPQQLRAVRDAFELEYDPVQPSPRWKTCANSPMNYAASRMYADKYFPRETKSRVDDMVLILKAEVQMQLSLNTWMDLNTKKKALIKAEAMTFNNAYPDWIMDDAQLDAYYDKMTFSKSSALENIMTFKTEDYANERKSLFKPDQDLWYLSPIAVNAYYDTKRNSFSLLTGILQAPFYDRESILAMNYGGIGMVIGHEVIHGFDANGRHINERGRYVSWWSDKSSNDYDQKAQCIQDQYSQYRVKSINKTLNAAQTQGEDIADMGGLRYSFLAYRDWVQSQGKEEAKLPGLEFAPDQLFFVNYAQVWCHKYRDDFLRRYIDDRVHSPAKFRIIGPLTGFKGFIDAFNCPKGSRMNPGKSCDLW